MIGARCDGRRCNARGTRGGGVLLMVLAPVVLIGAFAAAMLQLTGSTVRRQVQALEEKRAFYLAEAGLSESFAALRMGRSGAVGSESAPAAYGDGLLWATATPDDDGLVTLEGFGQYRSGRARLSMVVRVKPTSASSLGLFSRRAFALPDGSLIDSYDSRAGPYRSPSLLEGLPRGLAATASGRVGSNEFVTLGRPDAPPQGAGLFGLLGRSPVQIHGNVTVGPEGTVEHASGAVVDHRGQIMRLEAAQELEPVTFPDIELAPGLVHSGAYPLVVPAAGSGYESLRVESGSTVILQGPGRLALDSLVIAAGGELAFDTSQGGIELVVRGDVDLAPTSRVSTVGDGDGGVRLALAGSEGAARLACSGSFHGLVYAPEREIEVHTAFEVFGGLVADRLALPGPVRLHYDLGLGALMGDDGSPELVSWRIESLRNSDYGTARRDPFLARGVAAAALRTPWEAHDLAGVHVHVTFLGLLGVQLQFVGWEADFDALNVLGIIEVRRHTVPITFESEED